MSYKSAGSSFRELTNYDIVCLTETWTCDTSDIDIVGYSHFVLHRPKRKATKRNSGGIIVYIKDELSTGISLLFGFRVRQNPRHFGHDSRLFPNMASSMEADISTITKISTLEAASVAVYLYVITIEAVTLIAPKIQLYPDGYRICIPRVATVGYRITAR